MSMFAVDQMDVQDCLLKDFYNKFTQSKEKTLEDIFNEFKYN